MGAHTSLVLAYFANIVECKEDGMIANLRIVTTEKCYAFLVVAVVIVKAP